MAYYRQAVSGQWRLLSLRRSLEEVLADPSMPASLHRRLELARDLRDFASTELALPDNGSYRSYVDLHRSYVVKNLFATPALSLALRQWCFPVLGCVGYRGYFDATAARRQADDLRDQGDDVYLADVPAYSTLGWFDDPLLSTFVYWPVGRLAELIFHELAHQRLFIAGDTAFNESFATAVGVLGVRIWLAHYGTSKDREDYADFTHQREAMLTLVARTRVELARLYDSKLSNQSKWVRKQQMLADLRNRYQSLKQGWGGYQGYDEWFNRDLNNAKIAALNTYYDYLPAFEALFEREGCDFPAFYRAAEMLGKLPLEQRKAQLQVLITEWRKENEQPLAALGEQPSSQKVQQADHRKLTGSLGVTR